MRSCTMNGNDYIWTVCVVWPGVYVWCLSLQSINASTCANTLARLTQRSMRCNVGRHLLLNNVCNYAELDPLHSVGSRVEGK